MTAAVVCSWLSPTRAEKGNGNRCALASVRHSLLDSRFSHNCLRRTFHRFEPDVHGDQAVCVSNCQRVSQETPPPSNSRFVSFVLGAQYGFRNGGADPTDAVLGVAREKASTGSIQNN
jgi:hypothetical protein